MLFWCLSIFRGHPLREAALIACGYEQSGVFYFPSPYRKFAFAECNTVQEQTKEDEKEEEEEKIHRNCDTQQMF